MKVCNFNDPQLDACLKDSIQKFLPHLRGDNNSSDLPIIDPFSSDRLSFNYDQGIVVTGGFILKNVKTSGLSNAQVRNIKTNFADEGDIKFQGSLFVPELLQTAHYKSDNVITGIKIKAKGEYSATLFNVGLNWSFDAKLIDKDGQQYMKIEKFDVVTTMENAKMSVNGIFENDTMSKIFITSPADFIDFDFFFNFRLNNELVPESQLETVL